MSFYAPDDRWIPPMHHRNIHIFILQCTSWSSIIPSTAARGTCTHTYYSVDYQYVTMQPMAQILVAEDEELLSSIIVRELARAGHDVRAAYDGDETLKIAESTHPELILLDLIMPKVDGFQVLESLKNNPVTATIPVVVLSNLGQKEDIEKAKAGGALDYMVKINFAPKEVVEKVAQIMSAAKKDA